jgi:hypothetical protein
MTAFQEMFFGEQIQKRSIYSSLQRNKTTFSLDSKSAKVQQITKGDFDVNEILQTIKPHF